MKLFLTGTSMNDPPKESLKELHDYILLSFAYKQLESKYIETVTTPQAEIVLDSGAFTAWNIGKSVELSQYQEWAAGFTERHSSKFARIRYVNLDVIPGEKGRAGTPEEMHQAAIDSVRNAEELRAAGVPASEVFHQDEPVEVLIDIVERAEGRLICLSPRNDLSVQKRETWLLRVAAWCHRRYGLSNMPKAHGLGVTSERLLYSFPFYSCDSSSWIGCLRYGKSDALSQPMPRAVADGSHERAQIFALKEGVKKYQKYQDRATALWKERGIVWDD